MTLKKLWPHKYWDKESWKYIDVKIGGDINLGTAYISQWVLNPDFKYKHLDSSYQKEMELNNLFKGS